MTYVLLPFGLPPVRSVWLQGFYCPFLVSPPLLYANSQQAVYLRLAVAAFTAYQHDILDAVVGAHTLDGAACSR